MPILLTVDGLRKIFPRAPQPIIDAFVAKQAVLDKAGITHTRTRLGYAFSQCEHEVGGWTIKHLTENINYKHARAAQIWPSRFRSAADVEAKFGSAPGWQLKMFDSVYGNRMGNRPGTRDGSSYIGRAGPQITGRDGYMAIKSRTGIDVVVHPELATLPENQPDILAAFWSWKNLNVKADVGDYRGVTKLWNGGTIGMADREQLLAGNSPIIARLAIVDRILPDTRTLPGSPPTKAPPPEVIDATTRKERTTQKTGVGSAIVGGAGEATKATTTQPGKPDAAFLSPFVTYTLIGAGIAVVIVTAVLIAKKRAAVIANWN